MSRRAPVALVLAAALCAGGAAATPPPVRGVTVQVLEASGGLAPALDRLRGSSRGISWVGWSTSSVSGGYRVCCIEEGSTTNFWGIGRFDHDRPARDGQVCDLGSDGHWMGLSDGSHDEPGEPLVVLLRLRGGRIDRVRAASRRCSLDTGGRPLVWLEGVPPAESVAVLTGVIEVAPDDELVAGPALSAVALHDDPAADGPVLAVATGAYPEDLRRDAMFWLGRARGRAGYKALSRLRRQERGEMRRAALFGLSASSLPEALDDLIAAARRDPDPEARREALFWMAQKAGDRVVGTIQEALRNDPEIEVKRAAVFALAGLPDDEGVPLLIDLIRTHNTPEVRRDAMFWLAESGDARALDFIEEILTG